MKRLLIATDAWSPQVNGVVRTLQTTAAELARQQVSVHFVTPNEGWTVPCPSYPEIRLSLCARRLVAQAFDRHQPEALHISTEGPIGWAARRYALRHGLKFTTAYHTQFPEYVHARTGIPTRWTSALLRWFHAPSSGVFVPSPTLIQTLAARGFRQLRHWTRGVDDQLFCPSAAGDALRAAQTQAVFLYVGRVAVEKNIEAFLRLDLPGEKWVVGDGPQTAELQKAYPDVRWKGVLKGTALADAYRQATVFVFPSRTDTFGLVMAEAMACGTPVAAFPVVGPLDVVGPQGGVLDPDLRRACLQAMALPRDQVVQWGQQFTWQRATQQFQQHLVPLRGSLPPADQQS